MRHVYGISILFNEIVYSTYLTPSTKFTKSPTYQRRHVPTSPDPLNE